jgi:8-oxo-dGTP pyrophosphatase MutT (NUDIX family)
MKLDMIHDSKKAGCVVLDRGNVLLIKKDNNWQLPKGKSKGGESLPKAAIRETLEETGIKPSLAKAKPFTAKDAVFFLVTGSGKPRGFLLRPVHTWV